MEFFQLEWWQFAIKMLVAFILALPIGWERERHTRIMGLRTFPLVALGSTAYVLVSHAILREDLDAQARIIQGLITGIGFVGGGAILKDPEGSVQGTATAVSVWTTGALGIAVAYERFDIAIIISLVNYLTLRVMTFVKDKISGANEEV